MREDCGAFALATSSLTMQVINDDKGNGLAWISNFLPSLLSWRLDEHAHGGGKGLGSNMANGESIKQ